MEKEIVSNTSSIIFIGKHDLFKLVKNLYSNILTPDEVIKELFKYHKPENYLIKENIKSGFIKEINVKKINDFPLHIGEKAAISLCLEKDIPIFLSDDKKARNYARSLKIKTIGVLGIILENYKLKNINRIETKRIINNLIKNDFYITSELYARLLEVIDLS